MTGLVHGQPFFILIGSALTTRKSAELGAQNLAHLADVTEFIAMKIVLLLLVALVAGGFATTALAAREPVSLYCDGRFTRSIDSQPAYPAVALLQISANDFSLDIKGFGHGEAKGKLTRTSAFDLSGPVLFTPSAPGTGTGTAPFEALVVLQKYSGQLALRIPGDTSMSGVRYSGVCSEKRPLVDSVD